ncbi:AraC family transcriptional regulator [Dysgonomonas sp. Marseille-P4677]|uniref:AraC family transcriptional regulator n=1 Tax=Dysgonomonas sp. Marseille-P4677 TaxID=2364790 RepID=UPI001911615D|nr:AraC family transcriptional regulator [Dysgonomonas sp. Marseille-P4677]MBK5719846.1 AraC family transcriptional regulator [Dysgonomonas sp. Marseille-P4677]
MGKNMMYERLLTNNDTPIIARGYNYKHFTYPWHFHSEYEIIYVKEGKGHRFVGDSMSTFDDGDIIFLGSNLPHYMRSLQEYYEENDLRVKGVVIQFSRDFLFNTINNYTDFKHIKLLLQKSERGILFANKSDKRIKLISQEIRTLPSYSGIDRTIRLISLLDLMAKYDNESILGSLRLGSSLSTFTDSRLNKILSYISYNYNNEINVEKVAAMIPMNTSAFCRYFKKQTGKTFTEYVLNLRIGLACKLLLTDSKDISQIAFECGFNTICHFNKIFKRITGMAPTEYKLQFTK